MASNRPKEEQSTRPGWLRRTHEGIMEVISRDGTTAQLDPLRFCQWVLKEVKARGVNVHHPARATQVVKDQNGVLCGIRLQTGEDATSQTECKIANKTFTDDAYTNHSLVYNSTVHPPCNLLRRLVPPPLQHPLPHFQISHPHFPASRPLAARAEPALQARPARQGSLPRRLCHGYPGLLARMVCKTQRRTVPGRSE